jgi:hypothetical protein
MLYVFISLYVLTSVLWSMYAVKQGKIYYNDQGMGLSNSDVVITYIMNFIFCPVCLVYAIFKW